MTPTEHGTHDAIVIGAGITGLATASHIAAAGYDVLILEARDRVGGRLLTVADADGHPTIDLGPSWFWADELRVQTLVRELDIRTHAQHIAGDALFQPGDAVQRIAGNPIDAPAMRFQDGAQSLALALGERLGPSVRFDTPVAAVRIVNDLVEVDHREGASRARCAVVAVPPALAVAALAVLGWDAYWGGRLAALEIGRTESAYLASSRWAQSHLPPRAVLACMQTSGALFHYTDFTLLRYDEVKDAASLARIERLCAAAGRPIYAVLFPFETKEALERHLPGRWTLMGTVRQVTIWRREAAPLAAVPARPPAFAVYAPPSALSYRAQ